MTSSIVTDMQDNVVNNIDTSSENNFLRQENTLLQTKVFVLEEQLVWLKKKIFGSSSEKNLQGLNNLNLFEKDSSSDKEETLSEIEVTVKEYKRKKGGRKPFSDRLPREERIIDLSDEEKHCNTCGNLMEKIGEDVSERAEIIPPKLLIEKCIRPKCVCRHCDTPPVAKDLPYVLPHSIAANGLFAYTITAKFCDSIPFHRMEGILSRYGVTYPKANMCNNAIQFYEKYGERIAYLFEKQMIQGCILHIDETTLQVLRELQRKNKTKSYVWLFLGGGMTKVILFHYRQTRHADFLYDILEDYNGCIVTDGYAGYDSIINQLPSIEHAGCNAHARRYFVEAFQTRKHPEAETAIKFYSQLYQVEASVKENNLNDQLFSIRQKKSKPIMKEFRNWLDKKHAENFNNKKDLFTKAVNYTINQWPKLTIFLGNANVPIDNNVAENCIRPFVIGRNNWKFSGSPRGAEATCLFYSLIETAKINGHEPFWYLKQLFDKLPYTKNNTEIEKLMPYNLPPITGPD